MLTDHLLRNWFFKYRQVIFPKIIYRQLGDQYGLKSPDGKDMEVRVIEIDEENITLDANHPLAGKKLIFEFELVEIQ